MVTKSDKISPFMLAMITIALIVTLRGSPMIATHGLSSIFFYGFSAILFLLPVSMIAAEMATGWPEKGGIFLWVGKAFGNKWGFFATFMQWIPIVIFYPTALSFLAANMAYLIDPALAENKYYVLSMVLVIFWAATFINFRGLKTSGLISTICVVIGTLIPAAILMICGILYLFQGNASQIVFSFKNIIPDLSNVQNIVFLAGTLLLFAGMEISAVHVKEVDDPQKNYPKAIAMAASVIVLVSVLSTLSIAIVIPKQDISLVAGVLQAFSHFFNIFNLSFLTPMIALLISIGALGQVLSMILGPSKAMLASANRGDLPPFFKKVNAHNIPVNILITQGIIVSIFSIIFLMMPSVSSGFWILSVLVIELYLIMYFFFYTAAIKLRYKYPEVKRAFRIPGGKYFGMWLVALIGLIVALFVFIISFFPPLNLKTGSPVFFVGFLIISILIIGSIPLLVYKFKDKWK